MAEKWKMQVGQQRKIAGEVLEGKPMKIQKEEKSEKTLDIVMSNVEIEAMI